jgi:hypothetical protein
MEKSWAWWYKPVIPVTIGSLNRKMLVQGELGKK